MDAAVWGAPLWSLLGELVRRADDNENLMALLDALRWVIPCVYCRESYRAHLDDMPAPLRAPEQTTAQWRDALIQWLYLLHARVNAKLGRDTPLTLEQYQVRLRAWSTLLGEHALWDLLVLLACNYPRADTRHDDREHVQKRRAYRRCYESLAALLRCVPLLASVAPYLAHAPPLVLRDRAPFCLWVRTQRRHWLRRFARDAASVHAVLDAERAFLETLEPPNGTRSAPVRRRATYGC